MVSIAKVILNNYTSIPKAMVAAQRLCKIQNKSVLHGVYYGAKKAGKKVGTLPLLTAAAGVVSCPIPGAGFVGFTLGTIIKEGGKLISRLIK